MGEDQVQLWFDLPVSNFTSEMSSSWEEQSVRTTEETYLYPSFQFSKGWEKQLKNNKYF